MLKSLAIYLMLINGAEALFLAIAFLTGKKSRGLYRYLGIIMLIFGGNMLMRFVFMNGYLLAGFYASLLILPAMALIGPLSYLFIVNLAGEKPGKSLFLHLSPFALSFLIYFSTFLFLLLFGESVYTKSQGFHDFLKKMFLVIIGITAVSGLGYLSAAWHKVSHIKKTLNSYFSTLTPSAFRWLRSILFYQFAILFFILLFISFNLAGYTIRIGSSPATGLPAIVFFILIFFVAYSVLNQPELLKEIDRLLATANGELETKESVQKYAKQEIPRKQRAEILKELEEVMQADKPYLDESLTIRELAEKVDRPVHHLSIVLNDELKQNFYAFVNSYRVREAMALLSDKNNEEKNVLQVAYESGFNSKSVFNDIFKKTTGKTPSEFRRRYL